MNKKKFYAYFIPAEKKKGIVENWAACERIIYGRVGARYKSFSAKVEAEEWLRLGASYGVKKTNKLLPGIYFDAGTGRGEGVEISVTDEKGKNILHKALSKKYLNKFGKHLVGKNATNNYGELLACKYALRLALREGVKKVFGDSSLVIDYWTKWRVKKNVAEETFILAREAAELRRDFEKNGGKVMRISGNDNPADLGFHR